MNVNFVNPVISSIINVLSTMAQLTPEAGKPSLKENKTSRGILTGFIALEGEQASGSLAISFPEAVILEIFKRMMREEKTAVDDMVKDLTGEIANMVLGGAKQIFEEKGMQFGLTLPSILEGVDHQILHLVQGPIILLPLKTEYGEFYVEFCIKESKPH